MRGVSGIVGAILAAPFAVGTIERLRASDEEEQHGFDDPLHGARIG